MPTTPAPPRLPGTPSEFWTDTRGLSFVEYLIVLCVVALLGFASWRLLGQQVSEEVTASGEMVGAFSAASTARGSASGSPAASAGAATKTPARPSAAVGGASGALTGGASGAAAGSEGWSAGTVALGVGAGAWTVASKTFQGVYAVGAATVHAVSNPGETIDAAWDALSHPGRTASAVWNGTVATYDRAVAATTDLIEACATGDAHACAHDSTVAVITLAGGAAGARALARVAKGEYLGYGATANAYRRGDYVEKDVRGVLDPDGVRMPITRAERAYVADTQTLFTNDLRNNVPELHDIVPRVEVVAPGRMRQRYVEGYTQEQLRDRGVLVDDSVMEHYVRKAEKHWGLGPEGVSPLETGWTLRVDPSPENFRFDAHGNVTAWFDPVAIQGPAARRAAAWESRVVGDWWTPPN